MVRRGGGPWRRAHTPLNCTDRHGLRRRRDSALDRGQAEVRRRSGRTLNVRRVRRRCTLHRRRVADSTSCVRRRTRLRALNRRRRRRGRRLCCSRTPHHRRLRARWSRRRRRTRRGPLDRRHRSHPGRDRGLGQARSSRAGGVRACDGLRRRADRRLTYHGRRRRDGCRRGLGRLCAPLNRRGQRQAQCRESERRRCAGARDRTRDHAAARRVRADLAARLALERRVLPRRQARAEVRLRDPARAGAADAAHRRDRCPLASLHRCSARRDHRTRHLTRRPWYVTRRAARRRACARTSGARVGHQPGRQLTRPSDAGPGCGVGTSLGVTTAPRPSREDPHPLTPPKHAR